MCNIRKIYYTWVVPRERESIEDKLRVCNYKEAVSEFVLCKY